MTPGCRMPDGMRCSTVFRPPMTSVWPALWPPWKRTTPWAWSVSQSTTLPFPSSPHWVPMTTTLLAIERCARGPRASGSDLLDFPSSAALREAAVAAKLRTVRVVPGQLDDHHLAPTAQRRDRFAQVRVVTVRRENALRPRRPRRDAHELAKVEREAGGGAGPAERLADLVVAAAQRDRARELPAIGREHNPAVVVVAPQVGEVDARRHAVFAGEPREIREGGPDLGQRRERIGRALQHFGTAVELRQHPQRIPRGRVQAPAQRDEPGAILREQRLEQIGLELRADAAAPRDGAEDADVSDVEPHVLEPAGGERRAQEPLDLDVAFDPGMAVDLRADLQGLPRSREPTRPGMERARAVAQTGDALTVEQVSVDPRDLRRHVGPQAHRPTRQLVDQLERAQVEVMAGAGQERLDVLEQRRDDEFVAVDAEEPEQ